MGELGQCNPLSCTLHYHVHATARETLCCPIIPLTRAVSGRGRQADGETDGGRKEEVDGRSGKRRGILVGSPRPLTSSSESADSHRTPHCLKRSQLTCVRFHSLPHVCTGGVWKSVRNVCVQPKPMVVHLSSLSDRQGRSNPDITVGARDVTHSKKIPPRYDINCNQRQIESFKIVQLSCVVH